jgi:hypothetical protein
LAEQIQPGSRRMLFEPAVLFAMILAILGVSQAWRFSNAGIGFDFYQFWVAGQELQAGNHANLYTDEWRETIGDKYYAIGHTHDAPGELREVSDRRHLLQTFSSPLLYTLFSFIGSSNYAASLTIFKIISVVCGVVAVVMLCKLLDYSCTAAMVVVGAWFGWEQPFLSDVFVGNVNQQQLLMVAALLWIELRMRSEVPRDLIGGALLALIALFKPNLSSVAALLGVMWLVDGQWLILLRHIGGALIGAIVLIVVASIRLGSVHCWIDWLGALHQLGVEERTIAGSNYALVQIVREYVGPHLATWAGGLIGIIALLMVCVTRVRSSQGSPHRLFTTVALACALPLLTAPVAWLHYYIFCTPLILLMAKRIEIEPGRRLNAAVRYALVAVCFFAMSYSPILAIFVQLDDADATAIRLASAAVGLFGFGLWEMRLSRVENLSASNS